MVVPKTRNAEQKNWITTRLLRSKLRALPMRWPLRAAMGLNPERKKAGYAPDRRPTSKTVPINPNTIHRFCV
jgi:hypothetical protein